MGATAQELIARAGLRVTAQRVTVLEALMRERNDLTATQLFEQLRPSHASLGLATIYRTLNCLAEAGVIDVLAHGASTCFRYCSPGHHHHLTCSGCHKVIEIRDCDLDAWAARQGSSHGFRDVTHAVELTGRCGSC